MKKENATEKKDSSNQDGECSIKQACISLIASIIQTGI
jgi:hypothetical protein